MNTPTMKKVKQADVVLNFLNEKPGRKLSTERAVKLTKSTKASMQFLLPKMTKDGLLSRVDRGVYSIPGATTPKNVVKSTLLTKVKTTPKVVKSTPVGKGSIHQIMDSLMSEKESHSKKIEIIDQKLKKLKEAKAIVDSVLK
jgi:hypothetical protein